MRAEELRIGNWITAKDFKGPFQVAANTFSDVTLHNVNGKDFFKPIPLTEDWLKRFGFESHSPGLFRVKIHPDQNRYLETMLPSRDFWDMTIIIVKERSEDVELWIRAVKYVHELQNLIHSLTGEELKLN